MAVPLRSSFMRVLWVPYLAVIIRLNTVRGQGRLSSSQEQPVLTEEVRSALKEASPIAPSAGEAALHKVVLGTAGDDGAQSTSLMWGWRREPPEALVEFDNLHHKQKREVP